MSKGGSGNTLQGQSEICEQYKIAMSGASGPVNLPVGATVGAINFIGSTIIERLVPFLRCENMQNQRITMVIFIYIFTYVNSVLIAIVTSHLNFESDILQYS